MNFYYIGSFFPLLKCFSHQCLQNISRLKLAKLPHARHLWNQFPSCKELDQRWGSSKRLKDKRNVKLFAENQPLKEESYYEDVENQLKPLKQLIKQQGDVIRNLKASNASKNEIKQEVNKIKAHNKELEDLIAKLVPTETFDRARMEDLIKRRFYYDSSYDIYGGFAGQHDFGPLGCQMMENLLTEWQKHFVLREGMLKVSCSSLTPDAVLRASGHVQKFADVVVWDEKTREIYRLDHLIREVLETEEKKGQIPPENLEKIPTILSSLDGMGIEEMNDVVKTFAIKSPAGNDLCAPKEMNLMFPVTIGAAGPSNAFLRPETAQGIFTNFKKLLEEKQGKLPVACAQVGNVFRNEISPKGGILRMREFTLAEIEHFCYPDDKSHPKFTQVASTQVWLYSACQQMEGERPALRTVGDAVKEGLLANETIGYYLARTQHFMEKVGIEPRRLRFRQHLSSELAHYAADCWDAECLTTHGWVECAGLADRDAHDLTCHANATGASLWAERPLAEPRLEEFLLLEVNEEALSDAYPKQRAKVMRTLLKLSQEELRRMEQVLAKEGCYEWKGFTVTRKIIPPMKRELREVWTEKVIPRVIEPSFGIGRIFYAILEHSFRIREGKERRSYFSLPSLVAPIKVAVLAIVSAPKFTPYVQRLVDDLIEEDLSVFSEESRSALGRQYVRMDERSVPFCVTVDEDTLATQPLSTVTLRERNTTGQVRIPIKEISGVVKKLCEGKMTWDDVLDKWPTFISQSVKDDDKRPDT